MELLFVSLVHGSDAATRFIYLLLLLFLEAISLVVEEGLVSFDLLSVERHNAFLHEVFDGQRQVHPELV